MFPGYPRHPPARIFIFRQPFRKNRKKNKKRAPLDRPPRIHHPPCVRMWVCNPHTFLALPAFLPPRVNGHGNNRAAAHSPGLLSSACFVLEEQPLPSALRTRVVARQHPRAGAAHRRTIKPRPSGSFSPRIIGSDSLPHSLRVSCTNPTHAKRTAAGAAILPVICL